MSANKAEILDRIKETYNFTGHGGDKKLASFLGVPATKIAIWRSRGIIDIYKVIGSVDKIKLPYVLKGEKIDPITYEDIAEAVKIIDLLCVEKGINAVSGIKPRMVIVALKKQKLLNKTWAEMKDLMDAAIDLAASD